MRLQGQCYCGSVRFEAGTTTLPSCSLGVGGSLLNPASPSGGFQSNNGIVRFVGTSGSNSITPGLSKFYQLVFNGVGGNWTITANATSTNNTTFTQANTVTLAYTLLRHSLLVKSNIPCQGNSQTLG